MGQLLSQKSTDISNDDISKNVITFSSSSSLLALLWYLSLYTVQQSSYVQMSKFMAAAYSQEMI